MESDCKRQKDNCVKHDCSLTEMIILKITAEKVQNVQVSDTTGDAMKNKS